VTLASADGAQRCADAREGSYMPANAHPTALSGTLTALIDPVHPPHCQLPMIFADPRSRRTVTLGELLSRAAHVAGGFQRLGVRPGERIAAQLCNREEAVILQFAALLLNAVLVPVVPVLGPGDVTRILEDARPTALVTQRSWNSHDYVSGFRKLHPAARPPLVIVADGAPDGCTAWEDLEEAPTLAGPLVADEASVCLIIYTSGSTGLPKGVQHTRASIMAEIRDIDYRPSKNDSDLYLQPSAAGHIGGYLYPLRALAYGMRVAVMDGWNASLASQLVDRERVTVMNVTPFHALTLIEEAERGGHDLSCVRMLVIGGAPTPPGLVARADRAGMTAVRVYGMSEHPTIAIGRPDDSQRIRDTTDGYVTPGNAVRIVDDANQPVPPGHPGAVQVRGPEQFAGYTNASPADSFTEDGWFRTGDVGILSPGNQLTIVDRQKDIIIRGGENLSATEIEQVIGRHPAVAQVAVIGVADARLGERACAFVVLRPGQGVDLPGLTRHFAELGVARQKVPELLEFVSTLPRTATGKVRKEELRKLIQAD
jgi:acyl-CoA synthetase (AMP-forming)/AMP-acid ligase II